MLNVRSDPDCSRGGGFDYKAVAKKLAAVAPTLAPTQQDRRDALVLKLEELEVEKTKLEKELATLDGSRSDGDESTAKGATPSRDDLLVQLAEKTAQLAEQTEIYRAFTHQIVELHRRRRNGEEKTAQLAEQTEIVRAFVHQIVELRRRHRNGAGGGETV